MKNIALKSAASLLLLATMAPLCRASLSNSYQFNGNGNWSIDGVGSNSSPVGTLQAFVPTGSTVEKAFLYTSLTPHSALGSITFDGTLLSTASFEPRQQSLWARCVPCGRYFSSSLKSGKW